MAPQVGADLHRDIKALMIAPYADEGNCQQASKWLYTLLHKVHSLGVTHERATQLFPLLLAGSCIPWFYQLAPGVQADFTRLTAAFRTSFIERGPYKLITNRDLFYKAAQYPGEPVRQFAERLRELAQTIGIQDDATLISKFLSGILPAIHDKIMLHRPDNWATTVELAEAAAGMLPAQITASGQAYYSDTDIPQVDCFQAILDRLDGMVLPEPADDIPRDRPSSPRQTDKRVTFQDAPTTPDLSPSLTRAALDAAIDAAVERRVAALLRDGSLTNRSGNPSSERRPPSRPYSAPRAPDDRRGYTRPFNQGPPRPPRTVGGNRPDFGGRPSRPSSLPPPRSRGAPPQRPYYTGRRPSTGNSLN